MDQAYIRDQNITIEELVKQHVAQLGENIQVRRFVRFVLGEGIEKEETDFAAEVAAQMGQAPAVAVEPTVEPEAPAEPTPETPKAEIPKADEKKKDSKKKKK